MLRNISSYRFNHVGIFRHLSCSQVLFSETARQQAPCHLNLCPLLGVRKVASWNQIVSPFFRALDTFGQCVFSEGFALKEEMSVVGHVVLSGQCHLPRTVLHGVLSAQSRPMPLSATRPSAFHERKHLVAPHDSLLRTPAFAGLAPGEPVGTSGGGGRGGCANVSTCGGRMSRKKRRMPGPS